MSAPKFLLNTIAGAIGLFFLARLVVVPLYELLHLGVREHGSLTEDVDFYYTIIAVSLWRIGGGLGVAFSIIGLTCAFTSVLGFAVAPAVRQQARVWCWYMPLFWFFLELLGLYQIQIWYANHGLLFPSDSFLRDFAPHLWWLAAVWLATAPAILTGRGFFALLSFSPKPPESPAPPP